MAIGRRQYPFHLIEPKWQAAWDQQQTFRAWNPGELLPDGHPFAVRHKLSGKTPSATELPPKHYVLDMFPYPSGAGLHVGHPEGYTATDILARYRRAAGFNVLHPMGWDAFGLPAEQYAIRTGHHPRQTTEANIATFKRQIKSLGFSYDWSRELDTTDPKYFKWTQWIFLKLYNSWFNPKTNKAEAIETLPCPAELKTLEQKRAYRDARRLAFVSEAPVNWCPELCTVLANEEVVDGKSEVGGFPVVRRPMRQWMLRITAYAERLLADLDTIDWSHSLKEMQRNWIGRSEGAEVDFQIAGSNEKIRVFTTRPDTLFGATYMVLAPEHRIVEQMAFSASSQHRANGQITATTVQLFGGEGHSPENVTLAEALARARADGVDLIEVSAAANPPACILEDYGRYRFYQQEISKQAQAAGNYREQIAKKSDLERTDLAKDKSGVFTGAYAVNPANGEEIPIWIADYVLASYGTGAIMAVPAHDTRDFEFATKFNLPIVQVVEPADSMMDWHGYIGDGKSVNSTGPEISITGLPTAEAKKKITAWLESKGLGKATINYKLRDWLFSRQRYWGEPFPIVWKRDAAGNLYHEALPEIALPVLPPKLDDYKPTPDGQPPLARAQDWVNLPDGSVRETNTMPQWAGSCWYYLRYLDAQNSAAFVGKEIEHYWMASTGRDGVSPSHKSQGVDLYVGGTEHAVLHLLYARFWHKVLFDLGHVSTPEPFFKLVNQGTILGEDGQKMSKSRGNVVNPDDVVNDYGADAFRLYEMFLGPLEMVKPWNTKGVEGVYRFLGRVWRLFVDEKSETEFEQAETTTDPQKHAELLALIRLNPAVRDVVPSPAQLKTLHACIKKVTEDLDALRFNTAISALMVFVNEAMTWEVKPLSALRDFLILLQPFAPHLAEELWSKVVAGTSSSAFVVPPSGGPRVQVPPDRVNAELQTGERPSGLAYQPWPKFDPALLVEEILEIPVQVNGKLRDVIKVPAGADNAALEAAARASDKVRPFLEGKTVKKIIVVPKKLVNIAVG